MHIVVTNTKVNFVHLAISLDGSIAFTDRVIL